MGSVKSWLAVGSVMGWLAIKRLQCNIFAKVYVARGSVMSWLAMGSVRLWPASNIVMSFTRCCLKINNNEPHSPAVSGNNRAGQTTDY